MPVKRDADRAFSRIEDAKRTRDRVFAELSECDDLVGNLKDSRKRRNELIAAEQTKAKVVADRAALQSEIDRLAGAEGRRKRMRYECVANGRIASEIAAIEDRIREARAR